ncbi:RNA polymerase sigma factor [Aquisphaera insulae]|uniref:RNA polymerase sigma factor n=1 Tax=Aquisphaera insulae TaxID=2712864 RepID=UPI0013EC1347|nr:sigma-70 family RNA polymerase sigma factor [Aquisphaera insulae]
MKSTTSNFGAGAVEDLTDGQLLERFSSRRGEEAERAFAALIARHGPMVLGVCRLVLRDDHDAEDAFQATFLTLARKARTLRHPDRVGSWLYGVARNASRQVKDGNRRRLRQQEAILEARPAMERPERESQLEIVEEIEAIHAEIERLPERYKTVIVFCDLQGLTHEEAARRLGQPAGTISARLSRGRERLKHRLIRRGIAPSGSFSGLAVACLASTMPPALVNSTVRIAMNGLTGSTTGMAPASISAISRAASRSMLMAKLKAISVALSPAFGGLGGMIIAAVLAQSIAASPVMDSMQAEIERAWGDETPARALRTRCLMSLKVEIEDPAFGDLYFPNALISPGDRVIHWTDWLEDVARKRGKHYQYYRFVPPGLRTPPPGLERATGYNGAGSWVYTHGARNANVHPGDDPTARLGMDYFGDMIGFPGEPFAPSRTVAGEAKEVYRLDRLIPSGLYTIAGDEVVEGEPCIILDRPGRDRVWLARDKGWSIARREWRWSDGGPMKRRITNRDFRPLCEGAWLPHSATMEVFGLPDSRPGRRVGVLNATLLEVQANVPDLIFEPIFPDGTSVHDLGAGEMFLKGGASGPARDEARVRLAAYRPEFRPEPWWRSAWFVGGCVGLSMGLAALIWRKGLSR